MFKRLNPRSRFLLLLLGVSLLGVILTGIISPIYIEKAEEGWEHVLNSKINSIEREIQNDLEEKQANLLSDLRIAEQILEQKLKGNNSDEGLAGYTLPVELSDEYEFLVFDSENNLLAWSNSALVNQKVFYDYRFQPNEVYFYNSPLAVYLTAYDSLNINGKELSLALYSIFEKNYEIDNRFYKSVNPSEEYSEEYQTSVELYFTPNEDFSKDGRIYSFNILNNNEKKIGIVEFQKPARDTYLQKVSEDLSYVQSVFAFAAILLFILLIIPYVKRIKSRFVKLVFISLIIGVFRYAIYLLGILKIFEGSGIHDSKYFSSLLGYGIVNSPLELFISLICFAAIVLYVYKEAGEYFRKDERKSFNVGWKEQFYKICSFIIAILFVVLFFIAIRGFGSAVHSMIFDSSLRYFKGISLIPEFPKTFMLFNLLLFSFSSLIILTAFLLVIIKLLKNNFGARSFTANLFLLFIFFEILGFLYGYSQSNPQVSYGIRGIIILTSFSFLWFLNRNKVEVYHYFVLAFCASIISILTLNVHRTLFEKESLKRTAYEITRQNENLLRFAVYETLVESITNSEVVKSFAKDNTNPDAAAFKIWSSSILQRESLGCSINFLRTDLTEIGSFQFRFNKKYNGSWEKHKDELNELHDIKIISDNIYSSRDKVIRGIATIENVEGVLGYVAVNVVYKAGYFGFPESPEFLLTSQNYFNKAIDYYQLSYFDFQNGTLINSQANYSLEEEEILAILRAPFNDFNEAWVSFHSNGKKRSFFVLKVEQDNSNRIVAIGLNERAIGLSLFDFFKPFFIHSLVIVAIILLYILFNWYYRSELRLNFSSKLLLSFLFISLIPLILVAFFFRSLTSEKNDSAIENNLERKARSVNEYIIRYQSESSLNDESIYEKAAADLDIEYTLYKGDNFVYSSNAQYYNIGLIPGRINPAAKVDLFYNGLNYDVLEECIEKFDFKSLYYKTSMHGDYYTIKVSSAFNRIIIPLSGSDVDIFIFVSYFLAVIFIIIIGYILTKQLSQPLKELTNATKLVARGDLSVNVAKRSNDEIGELVDGFNFMVNEINKNQAEIAELERETAWKEMARQVAHEIKNPLTPMKLSVQQLIAAYNDKSPKFDSFFQKVTQTVINQIETLKNIASEFSSFARMPNPKIEIISLNKVVDEAYNLFNNEKINIDVIVNKDIYIEADADQLRRVFINMIRNAIQAKATKIIINVNKTDENILIRITDNGSGIPDEIKEKIFESNFTTKEKGMGLGLTMAKRTIENIGGSIEVEETSSNGTTLLIKLKVL